MEQENTVANKIMQKDPEAFELLQKMLERTAMYVGINRFDYFFHAFSGYCWGRGTGVEFMPNQELQYWLLHNQSASLSGEISGRSLFFRCFGVEQISFDKYKEFLYASLPEKWPEININDDPFVKAMTSYSQAVDVEIHAHESSHDLVQYDWADNIESDYHINLARSVIDNIKKMIDNSGVSYIELRVYVRKECLFTQVRFLYRSGQEWSDDCTIIDNHNNHDLLIALHANAKNASSDALRECGCDVIDKQDYDFVFVPNIVDYADEKTFHSGYLKWKSS